MEFEWDEAKSEACLARRGFDFAFASEALRDPALVVERDARFDYGEPRFVAIGAIDGRMYVVVNTPRQGKLRLISARKANRREVRRYGIGARDADG